MAKNVPYTFSVYVRNPATPNTAPGNISIAATFSSTPLGAAGTKDDMMTGELAMTNPPAGVATDVGAGVELMDLQPMYIREPTLLLKTIEQSSFSPCDLNTITVALRSNVPLLTTEQDGCAPMLTLSGLSGSATMGDHLNISGAATTVLQTRAPWTQATGTLELSPSVGRFEAGVEYTFTFALNNSAVPQVCQTPNLQPRRPQLSLHPRLPPLIP